MLGRGGINSKHICSVPNENFINAYSLSIGGNNCSVHFNNSSNKVFEGINRISIKPGVRTNGGRFIARISNDPNSRNTCEFSNICYDTSPLTQKEYKQYSLNTSKRLNSNIILVHPNPNSGIFFIKNSSLLNSLDIYNMIGQKVMTQRVKLNEVNASRLKNGIYTLVLHKKDGSKETIKIIINSI